MDQSAFILRTTALLLVACVTGLSGFTVTTTNANVLTTEGEGAELTCSYSADFGSDANIEWKFVEDKTGLENYVYFAVQPTTQYRDRVTISSGNLRFNQVTSKDTGVYHCVVTGNAKYGEVTVRLTVEHPTPPPSTSHTSSDDVPHNQLLKAVTDINQTLRQGLKDINETLRQVMEVLNRRS